MALEMKVYQEITGYQAKVMLGMSWRQLACSVAALLLGGGAYAGLWALGAQDLGQWFAVLVTIPFGALGWVRPKGLPFEEYAKYIIRHNWEQQLHVYGQRPLWSVDHTGGYGAQKTSRQPRRRRARVVEYGR